MNRLVWIFGLFAALLITAIVLVKSPSGGLFANPKTAGTVAPKELPLGNSNMLTIGNTHYLFDVVDNGPEELGRLFMRAESLAQNAKTEEQDISIAMVIHGPDLNIFENRNYHKYKSLVDTAARLDAFGVIDFKLCQVLAFHEGFNEEDFPPFMEFVPFGPDEITRLKAEGYVDF